MLNFNCNESPRESKGIPPENTRQLILKKIEEISGPIPNPEPGYVYLPYDIADAILQHFKRDTDTGSSLSLILAFWLSNETIYESNHIREMEKLQKNGLISYNSTLNLATLNEESFLDFLNQLFPNAKG